MTRLQILGEVLRSLAVGLPVVIGLVLAIHLAVKYLNPWVIPIGLGLSFAGVIGFAIRQSRKDTW